MKFFMLICSIYLFVLPGLACAQTVNCTDEFQSSVAQTTDHEKHEDEKDGCGNFCNCTCCIHIVSVSFQLPMTGPDKPLLKNNIQALYHNISLPSNFFGNIWQPPRLG